MKYLNGTIDWLGANRDALLVGTLVAAMLVLVMLGLRWLGH